MDRSRRRVLALTSSLTLPALAGCFGFGSDDGGDGGSGSSGDGGSNDNGGGSGSGEGTETNTTSTETDTSTPTPQPESMFVQRTRGIMEQISWFGTEFPRARRQFLLNLDPVVSTITDLQEQNTLTASDAARLRDRTTAFAEFNQRVMAPHFELDDRLVVGDNFMVQNFEQAIERDDTANQQQTLNQLSVFYERLANESYLALNISAHPIRDPLHSMLIAGETEMIFGISYPQGNGLMTQTFSDEYQDLEKLRQGKFEEVVRPHAHTFTSGQQVFDHAHPYSGGHDIFDHGYGEETDEESEPPDGRLYAFADDGVDILKDGKLWRDRMADYQPEFTNIFDGVIATDGREDYAYVMANELVTEELDPQQFTGRPVMIQRYESPEAAAAAEQTLFETRLREEGTNTMAGREWKQVFYDYDGPNLYANLIRAEEFVVTAAVSAKPHGNRKEQWEDDYLASWLGIEEPSTEGTTTEGDE